MSQAPDRMTRSTALAVVVFALLWRGVSLLSEPVMFPYVLVSRAWESSTLLRSQITHSAAFALLVSLVGSRRQVACGPRFLLGRRRSRCPSSHRGDTLPATCPMAPSSIAALDGRHQDSALGIAGDALLIGTPGG
jgi:hypothetical protein